MFENKWCILIKNKKINMKHLKYFKFFLEKNWVQKTVIMNAERHDKIFSITSHLPHLIAYNLVKSAQDFEKNTKNMT